MVSIICKTKFSVLGCPLCKRLVLVDLQRKKKYKKVCGSQASVAPLTTESSAFSLIQCSERQSNRKLYEKRIVPVFLPSPSTPSPSVLRCYARMSGGGKQMKSVPACDQRHHPSCMLVTSQLRPSSCILPPPPRLLP